MCKDLLTLFCLLGVMFYQDWRLATISIIAFPLVGILSGRLGRRMKKASTESQIETGVLASLLSENLEDEELRTFYRNLMVSEANHYTMFLQFARKYGGETETNKKWQALLDFEAEIMKDLGKKETIHG